MKVSIIVRAYNSERTIQRALDSTLAQTLPKDQREVIVVNDGSTDTTEAILTNYGDRIVGINQKNQGAITAANQGFRRATGDYMMLLDADDAFEPEIAKTLSDYLDVHAEIDFVYPSYYEVANEQQIVVTPRNIYESVAIGTLFRSQKLRDVGFYRPGVFFAEYELLLRTEDSWRGAHIATPLFTYFRQGESLTASDERVQKALQQLKDLYPNKLESIKKIRGYSW